MIQFKFHEDAIFSVEIEGQEYEIETEGRATLTLRKDGAVLAENVPLVPYTSLAPSLPGVLAFVPEEGGLCYASPAELAEFLAENSSRPNP